MLREYPTKIEPFMKVKDRHIWLLAAFSSLEEVNEKHESTHIKTKGTWTTF